MRKDMRKDSIGRYWGNYSIFEIWLFCTAFDCRLDINDGRITKVTCKPRKECHED